MNKASEKVKSNQWWFSKSKLRKAVENLDCIELIIGGRRCVLKRSDKGKDGRPTMSFNFLSADDRAYWRKRNGQIVEIELVDSNLPKLASGEIQNDEKYISSATKASVPKEELRPEAKIFSNHPENRLFDAYLFVDWSSNNKPKLGRDSIWIAEGFFDDQHLVWGPEEDHCFNASTREEATIRIRKRLQEHLANGKRVLVCFDFAYSYPKCHESAKIGTSFLAIWNELSERIIDNDKNSSNRFYVAGDLNRQIEATGEGPFWGRPTVGDAVNVKFLASKKPTDWTKRVDDCGSLKEFRVVEERLKKQGLRPFSVWQLYGNGSVGSQVLVGLPRLNSLRNDSALAAQSKVWPFETGFKASFEGKTRIVHAEFWPGAIKINESRHSIRDAAQVMSCVEWAATSDANGRLGSFFDPLTETDVERELAQQEGWILGFIDR